MKLISVKKIISVFWALTLMLSCSAFVGAEAFNDESEYEVINFDVSDMETVTINMSQIYRSAMSVSLPYSGSILFGANSTSAASPVFDVSFSSNTEGLNVKPTNFTGTKKLKISIYVHLEGESSTLWHCTSSDDYTFNGIKGKKFTFGTSTTTIDKVYIVFGGGTSGYASEFDYSVSIS